MSTASKVIANAPIPQRGAYGYLLWLRRDNPIAYATAVKQIPQVAQFEAALPKAARGLGDDFDIDVPDIEIDAPADVDTGSSFALDSSTTDLIGTQSIGIDTSLFPTEAPSMPAITAPPDTSPSAASTAASIAASVLPAIAKIVSAAAPVAAAVINKGTAAQNAATVAKANQTAQLQYAAAVAGGAPLQTGLVTTAGGLSYIAPISALGGSLSSALSASVMGIPIWILALGGFGLVALLSAKENL
jgi:hypothetical protein